MTRASRSAVHMLNTFAMRMEIEHGPKDAVKALQLFTKDRTIRRAEKRDFHGEQIRTEDDIRVERQRSAFAMVPDTPSLTNLKDMMLQRAYDLLWDGDPMGCDAILEFIPSKDAEKLLNAWSNDFEGDRDRSSWYGEQK